MEHILSHAVGAVPLSMFHEDGQIHRNQKPDLGVKLEKSMEMCTELPPFSKQNTIVIRDAMSIVLMIDGNTYSLFSNLGDTYLDHLLKGSYFGNTLIDVFDRYDDMSIKTEERL